MDDSRELKEGEMLFQEGDPSDGCIYVVNTGVLVVSKGKAVLGELHQGDFVGETSLLINEARGATVRAKTDAVVLVLDEQRFLNAIQRTPQLALKIMRGLANRLRASNARIAEG